MKNDPYFKFLAAVILAGVVLACWNATPTHSAHSVLRALKIVAMQHQAR